jgi:hypothetical protein
VEFVVRRAVHFDALALHERRALAAIYPCLAPRLGLRTSPAAPQMRRMSASSSR